MTVIKSILKELLYSLLILMGATFAIYFLISFTMHNELYKDYKSFTYWEWLIRVISADNFGLSGNSETAVQLAEGFKLSLKLTFGALAISSIVSVSLAFGRIYYSGSKILRVITDFISTTSSVPIFLLAIFIRPFWIAKFQILDMTPEVSLYKSAGYYLIPIIILSFGDGMMGEMIKHIKDSLAGIERENYIKVATARNANKIVHIARAGLLPITSIVFSKLPFLLGGSIIIEFIFFNRGIGIQALEALGSSPRNVEVMLLICLYFSFIIAVTNLFSRIALILLDPRVRK